MTKITSVDTYIPLYRKYRPSSFSDLCGQAMVTQTLSNAIALHKVAHAYLFCGPRGTGKTSAARIFAKSLNCEQGPTVSPCMSCPSCEGIAQGQAMDVVEFDAASNNGVGDARELIENCQYRSMSGRFKVYIVDEVHMLTTQAFNALLKTLEEPPENVVFIFATTEAHKVLPTIVSRCQRFDFSRITLPDIVDRLRYIAELENIIIADDALLTIAQHAKGGLRDAVGLLDQVSVLAKVQPEKCVERHDVIRFTGTLQDEVLLTLSQAIARKEPEKLMQELKILVEQGVQPAQILKDLTSHFRNLLMAQTIKEVSLAEILGLSSEFCNALKTQLPDFESSEVLPQVLAGLASTERNLRHVNNPYLWLEVGLLDLAYRHDIHQVKQLAQKVSQLESAIQKLQQHPVQYPKTSSKDSLEIQQKENIKERSYHSPPTEAPSLHTDHLPAETEIKEKLTKSVSSKTFSDGDTSMLYAKICQALPSLILRSLLQQQTEIIQLTETKLVIGCVGEVNMTTVKKPEKIAHIKQAVQKVLGKSLTIEIVLIAARSAEPSTPPEKPQKTEKTAKTPQGIPGQEGLKNIPQASHGLNLNESAKEMPASNTAVTTTPEIQVTTTPQRHVSNPSIQKQLETESDKGNTQVLEVLIDEQQSVTNNQLPEEQSIVSSLEDSFQKKVSLQPDPQGDSALEESKTHAMSVLKGRLID